MSGNIPYAQPFPWDSLSVEKGQQAAIQSLQKHKFVGSGLAVLRDGCLGPQSQMGDVAKNILLNLFHQHGIEIPDGESGGAVQKARGAGVAEVCKISPLPDTSDDVILRDARQGKLSLFLSILNVIENSDGPVSSYTIMKDSCLVLHPGELPGNMDAKDIVLAALHFLSSKYTSESDILLKLPLIRCVQLLGDMERRCYQKVGTWTLKDIKEKVLKIEDIFMTSPSSWEWIQRGALCPRGLSTEDEKLILMKGLRKNASLPSVRSKKASTLGGRKRKASTSSPSVSRTGSTSSIVPEASAEDISAPDIDDDYDDCGSVVEAVIVDDNC